MDVSQHLAGDADLGRFRHVGPILRRRRQSRRDPSGSSPALTGVFYATVLLLTADAIGGGVILPVGVAVIAFFMCAQANWKTLAFIPGAFAGCAAVFGAAGDWLRVAIALVIGPLLGWASEALAGLLTRPRAARVTAGAL